MNTETRKRLEEAAKESVYREYNCKGKYPCSRHMDCEMCGGYNTPYDCCECAAGDYKEGFLAGAEYGCKEAIALVRKWLDEQGKLDKLDLVEFDIIMNKLWEDEK